jgi:NADPH:quinone reductase-like Zn-dependent oxidoreductase
VYAAGVTPTERTWAATYQTPDGRVRLPSIPGHDVSGVVDAPGPDVTDVSPGDAVYGLIDFPRDGSAAEYVAVRAADLAPKPSTLDHVHAAAVPLSALTAWQALFIHAGLAAGQRVLIHGAVLNASRRPRRQPAARPQRSIGVARGEYARDFPPWPGPGPAPSILGLGGMPEA